MLNQEISVTRITWSIAWRAARFLVVRALLIALMIVPFGPAMSAMEDRPNPALSLDLNVASVVTILVATWVMTRFIDRRPFRRRALAPKHAMRDAAAGLLIGNAWLGVCLGGSKGWPDAG